MLHAVLFKQVRTRQWQNHNTARLNRLRAPRAIMSGFHATNGRHTTWHSGRHTTSQQTLSSRHQHALFPGRARQQTLRGMASSDFPVKHKRSPVDYEFELESRLSADASRPAQDQTPGPARRGQIKQ